MWVYKVVDGDGWDMMSRQVSNSSTELGMRHGEYAREIKRENDRENMVQETMGVFVIDDNSLVFWTIFMCKFRWFARMQF